MELFEQIRREYEFGVGTIAGVAKKLGVHRRMVREAIGSALPKPRKKTERPRWKLQAAVDFVDAILEADRKAPRKQRHTAHRIWERIQHELPDCKIGERTVRQYVHNRKIALGLLVRETCVPQSYAWGVEAQVDWYEAYADLAGERIKLQVFAMRSMASGAAFHCAYLHATQQAFLEAHELAFAYFGGVFRKLRYDNLTSAVKKILRGSRREETARFVAFRSHWRFEAEFCTPAEAHEKGGIEGEAGYFRRNHWVPVPQAEDVADLNRQLLIACQQDEHRMIAGREQTVGAGLVMEREHLLPLATEGIGSGANELSDGQRSGMRQGADERLFGAAAGGHAGPSQSLCQHDGAVARGPMRGSARALLPAPAADSGSGALPRCPVAEARRFGGIEAAGAEAASRFVAAELRSDLAGTDRAAWKAERHQADDRSAQAVPEVWSSQAAGSDRIGLGQPMLRCRGGPAPAERTGTAACQLARPSTSVHWNATRGRCR